MANSIDTFKSKLVGGGARANLFKVTVNFPTYAGGDSEQTSFMVKASSFPASTITPIEVPFRGRIAKLAGERTFEPWTISVLNDASFSTRDAFERWSNGINSHEDNNGAATADVYESDMLVEQLDRAGNVTKTVTLRGCWPSNVGAIEVSSESADTIEEFEVEFQITYWTSNTTS